jgi:hypothetical protein
MDVCPSATATTQGTCNSKARPRWRPNVRDQGLAEMCGTDGAQPSSIEMWLRSKCSELEVPVLIETPPTSTPPSPVTSAATSSPFRSPRYVRWEDDEPDTVDPLFGDARGVASSSFQDARVSRNVATRDGTATWATVQAQLDTVGTHLDELKSLSLSHGLSDEDRERFGISSCQDLADVPLWAARNNELPPPPWERHLVGRSTGEFCHSEHGNSVARLDSAVARVELAFSRMGAAAPKAEPKTDTATVGSALGVDSVALSNGVPARFPPRIQTPLTSSPASSLREAPDTPCNDPISLAHGSPAHQRPTDPKACRPDHTLTPAGRLEWYGKQARAILRLDDVLPPQRGPRSPDHTLTPAERLEWYSKQANAILRLDDVLLSQQGPCMVEVEPETHGYYSPRCDASLRIPPPAARVPSPSPQRTPSHSPRVPPPQSSPLMRPCLRGVPSVPSQLSAQGSTDDVCEAALPSERRRQRLAALGTGGSIPHEVDMAARSLSLRRCSKELQKKDLQLGYLDRWSVRDPVNVQLKYS